MNDARMTSTLTTWHGFSAGQRVVMLIETRGATADGEEITHAAGSYATIDDIDDFGRFQGRGVHVTIGEGDRTICNSFDERDEKELGGVPFRSV
jgi:hypothetical protein